MARARLWGGRGGVVLCSQETPHPPQLPVCYHKLSTAFTDLARLLELCAISVQKYRNCFSICLYN